ncbi:MAG TPA: acyclic terpene utilization AtuA family protein, partial [Micromonosporaceae bacterium]|nr:acyclic terpene utilization AtuA family protein [Micromonosporaceae bacterium]
MIRIGNASGFYGDRFTAWREMLDGGPLDVLTGDYLAELTMLILGRDRMKDPALGYARTFLRQMEACLGTALDRGVRIVTNAGGLNPAGLAAALRSLCARLGLEAKIGYVEGDALSRPDALTANAYLGAYGIAACLEAGADVVVTGRVTDASLVVGPAIERFGWGRENLDALAGATLAGHLIECGAQVTGGNFSFFTELPDRGHRPGFPIAEVHADGSAVITKHPGTGGAVTTDTVVAQLLYEIAGPDYLGPDVVTHFDTVTLRPDGPDRVLVTGTRGAPPPPTLKVGINKLGGFRNSMTFVLCGLHIEEKAALVQGQLEESVGKDGLEFVLARTDHPDATDTEAASALLHVHLRDSDRARAGRAFSAAAVELALASYPGCTLTTQPGDATPYGIFTADLVPQEAVEQVAVLPSG